MYAYEIQNRKTKQTEFIFGYTSADAFRRAELVPNDWEIMFYEYVG